MSELMKSVRLPVPFIKSLKIKRSKCFSNAIQIFPYVLNEDNVA